MAGILASCIQARRGASRRADLDNQGSQGQQFSEQATARHGLAQAGHSHEQAVGPMCKLQRLATARLLLASDGGGGVCVHVHG
jgi:hypothetical protein